MRIAYILNSLAVAGAERQAIAVAERMVARGHTVTLLVLLPRLAEQCPARLDVVHLDLRRDPIAALRGYLHARQVLRGFRPDIIHSHNFHGNMLGRVLGISFPAAGVISTIHNVDEGG